MATSTKPMSHGPIPSNADPSVIIRDLAFRVIGTNHGRDYWMTLPSAELGGKTPEGLIRDGRADIVERYLISALEGESG